ncbi:FecR domain-containing protein [Phenylobacterium sp.]|uniref:FecR domain-containing protein n=1 Tax=Phenylobacterium sp. TaxID=1871053 RepID=UPI003BAA1680
MFQPSRARTGLMACSALALTLAAGSAQAAEWRLTEVTGTVRIAVPGAEAAPARLNQLLPTGSSVTTTLGARASLDNGAQHIVVGPNSRMTVAPDAGGFTRIAQDLGAIMFKVDKQKAPHFRVDTPLLAAIVKGTTFTVVVGPQADAVNVAEGLVEVRANATDTGSDVPAGASGTIWRNAPQAVQVGAAVTPTANDSAAVKIEPLDYKSVSGGLVDSGGPAAIASEARSIAAATGAPGGGGEAGAASAMASQVARNERQPEFSAGNGGGGQTSPDTAPGNSGNAGSGNSGNGNAGSGNNGNGNGATSTDAAPGNSGAAGNGNNGNGNAGSGNNGNGNGATSTDTTPGNSGNAGNGNNGNGNGGASTDTGAVTTGNGNGNNGNGNGNGGGATDTGAGTTGNGNSGAATGAVTTGNGNGNNGNGNGGGATDTGAGTTGNGNSGAATGAVTTGNGNGNNGNGNGNGNGGGATDTGVVITGAGNGNGAGNGSGKVAK